VCSSSDAESGGLSYIEQLTAAQECSTPRRPFLRGVNHEERKAVFFQPRCKLWSCSYCAQVNRALWTARAYHGAEVLTVVTEATPEAISFLTLTSSAKLGPDATMRVFSSAWDVLLKRARRSGSQGQYLLIPERHKDGRLHAHAVETFNLGTRWWKDSSAECGLGYMAEEEEARTPGGAAYYVAKYLAKSLGAQNWPKGWRRVRTSRNWPKLPELPPNAGWDWSRLPGRASLAETVARLEGGGYEVVFLDHVEAWKYVGSKSDCET